MAAFRVLIADNNEVSINMLAESADSIGHSFTKALSHKRAVDFITKIKYDYFIINLLIPFYGGKAEIDHCINLIDKIRDYYPRSLEYPIIVFNKSPIPPDELCDIMEAGANTFLALSPTLPEDKKKLRRAIKRLMDKALSNRKEQKPTVNEKKDPMPPKALLHRDILQYTSLS